MCCRSSTRSTARMRVSIRATTRASTRGSATGATSRRSRRKSTSWRTSSSTISRATRRSFATSDARVGFTVRRAVSDARACISARRDRRGSPGHLSAAAGLAVHGDDARRRRAPPYCGPRSRRARSTSTSRTRAAASTSTRYWEVRGERRANRAARCRRLRDQEARHELLHDPGDLRVHRRSFAPRARALGMEDWSRFTRTIASRSRSPGTSTGSTTSRCRRWCCTRCFPHCSAARRWLAIAPAQCADRARHA